MFQQALLLEPDRLGGGRGRDAGVAVAVAADPGAEPEEGRHSPLAPGVDPPQAGFDDCDRAAGRRRAGSPRPCPGRGGPHPSTVGRVSRIVSESQRVSTSSAIEAMARSRSRGTSWLVSSGRAVGDRRELAEDRPAPGLARVRGEHRADQGALQVLGDLIGVDPPVAELPEGGLGALVHRRRDAAPRSWARMARTRACCSARLIRSK